MLLVLVAGITVALLIERITFALVSLAFHLFNQGADGKSTWFVANLFQNITALAGAAISSVLRLFSFSIRGLIFSALFLMVWGVAFICAQYSSEALVTFQRAYNSDVGGGLRLALLIPLQLVQLLWDGIAPVYNLLIYCATTIPTRVLIENILQNVSDFESSMLYLGKFIGSLTSSLIDYISKIINQPDSFDPNLRLLDLITPLAYWRLSVSYLLVWLGKICAFASALVDIIAYPFLDINFGLGVHNLINSILTLLIQVPAVTIQRCKASGHIAVYCLPDFEPVTELAVIGIRYMGLMVDNWLDVASIVIQALLTNTSPMCSGWSIAETFNDPNNVMGVNETAIVGIDANYFAKTDGWNIQIFSRTVVERASSTFPFLVNVNYGIALLNIASGINGLMGCACSDQDYGMQLLCAVVPLDSLMTPYYVPVEFNLPSTGFYMKCNSAKIQLESIRWPVTRFTSPNSKARNSPIAQAALYVMPACSSESDLSIVCLGTFKLANCFPYCMALYTKGSRGSLILRSDADWTNSVAMVSRDCGLHTWNLLDGDLSALISPLTESAGIKTAWFDAEVQLNETRCEYAPNTFSRILRNITSSYNQYRSIRMPGQPFAFAGDLILTAVNTAINTWGIDVRRIWGNQANEFTIIHINKFIPALEPCKTKSDCRASANSCGRGQCRVAVPYAFDETPWANIPAVATDSYAFWITNPSMSMYNSFNLYCRGRISTLGFEIESAYSSIQIWRIDPYEFCPVDPKTGVRRCPEDNSATFRTLPGFVPGDHGYEVCDQAFWVLAPVIEYVNEYNIAITVLNTTFSNIDTSTLKPINASLARSVFHQLEV